VHHLSPYTATPTSILPSYMHIGLRRNALCALDYFPINCFHGLHGEYTNACASLTDCDDVHQRVVSQGIFSREAQPLQLHIVLAGARPPANGEGCSGVMACRSTDRRFLRVWIASSPVEVLSSHLERLSYLEHVIVWLTRG